jgi:hypothetical protein
LESLKSFGSLWTDAGATVADHEVPKALSKLEAEIQQSMEELKVKGASSCGDNDVRPGGS